MPPALIGAVAAPLVSGAIGAIAGAGQNGQADSDRAAALQQYLDVNVPDVQQQQVILQQLKSQGQLTPQMESALQQGPSALQGVSVDPRLRQAQMSALSSLQGLGSTGLNATDREALFGVQNAQAQQNQAQQASILQNMAQRGALGSGEELAARLSASQAGQANAQQQGLGVAAQAQARALQAIQQSGQLGGQMENQQFGEDAQKAAATDAINRFNTQNSQQVQGTNVNASNQAQAANLANAQRIADTNTGLANQQSLYNSQLYQQQYQNQLQKAAGAAGQYNNSANAANQNAARTGQTAANIGSGVGNAFGAYGQYQNNQDFLNALKNKAGTSGSTPPPAQ